jgi:hypothetical protein
MEDDIDMHTKNGEVAPHSYTHIWVTAGQAREIQAAIDTRSAPGGAGRYNLLFRNCAQSVEGFLNAGEVYGTPPEIVFLPFVFNWLVEGAAHSQ